MPDLSAARISYDAHHLREDDVPAEPFALFDDWLADAIAAREHSTDEPTAMTVTTVERTAEGVLRPQARMCLLKGFDERGFVFFTNYGSAKGRQIEQCPQVGLLLYWPRLFRQVRIDGTATRVDRTESEAYFATRPVGHQIGAWASEQSRPVASLEELQESYDAAAARFADEPVPCPPTWGGFRVAPEAIEFWQGQRSRMHDRLRYSRVPGGWSLGRLAP